MDREAWQATAHGVAKSWDTTKQPTYIPYTIILEMTSLN